MSAQIADCTTFRFKPMSSVTAEEVEMFDLGDKLKGEVMFKFVLDYVYVLRRMPSNYTSI